MVVPNYSLLFFFFCIEISHVRPTEKDSLTFFSVVAGVTGAAGCSRSFCFRFFSLTPDFGVEAAAARVAGV